MKKQSYIEANNYGRSIYDGFYKLAAITFTFNAILLTGLSLSLGDRLSDDYRQLVPYAALAFAAFGIVFNFGAFVAFKSAWKNWRNLHQLLLEIEADEANDAYKVQEVMDIPDTNSGGVYWGTNLFYGLLILAWLLVGWWFW